MGVFDYGCETCASPLSPAGSPDRSVRPGGRLRIRPVCGVRADGDVGDDRFRNVRRLHEDDGAATAARAEALQGHDPRLHRRSEEHTSELQSLMRISYAVFCLKKKRKKYKEVTHATT